MLKNMFLGLIVVSSVGAMVPEAGEIQQDTSSGNTSGWDYSDTSSHGTVNGQENGWNANDMGPSNYDYTQPETPAYSGSLEYYGYCEPSDSDSTGGFDVVSQD